MQEAAKTFFADAAVKVFNRYSEAPDQADSGLAEKFLKTPIDRITTMRIRSGLSFGPAADRRSRSTTKGIVSIKDYLGKKAGRGKACA